MSADGVYGIHCVTNTIMFLIIKHAVLAQSGERMTEDHEGLCSIHRNRIFFARPRHTLSRQRVHAW